MPTPQPTRQAFSSGMSSSIFTAESTATVVTLGERRDAAHLADRLAVEVRRKLSVVAARPDQRCAPRSQRFCMPGAHQRHCPHAGQEREDDVVALLPAGVSGSARGARGDKKPLRPRRQRPSAPAGTTNLPAVPRGSAGGAGCCRRSTFAQVTTVAVDSAVKVSDDIPVGCGVGTGWGSAVNSAEVRPGDTVIVMGVGGNWRRRHYRAPGTPSHPTGHRRGSGRRPSATKEPS